MSSKSSVQIIIPYYREYEFFREALESVINQNYSAFSVLVIDDGTKDNRVVNLINSLEDTRITLIQNETNLGLARNFEFARSQASADYLVFLGQDDKLGPDYISTVLPWILTNDRTAIVQPKVGVIDALGVEHWGLSDVVKSIIYNIAWLVGEKRIQNGQKSSVLKGPRAIAMLLIGDFLYFPNIMWKSSNMTRFDITQKITLDYRMLIDVLDENSNLILISKKCAYYRRHSGSVSSNPANIIDRIFEERATYRYFSHHPHINRSILLRFINFLRLTHRLHVLNVVSRAVIKRDWETMSRAMVCLI